MTTRLLLCVVAFGLASCAARSVSPQLVAELGKADALTRDGCYRCLQEAMAIYERVAQQRRAPAGTAAGALRIAVLLATRAKELGLPEEPAAELIAAWAAKAPPRPYLAALPLVTGEMSGVLPEEREQRNRDRRAAWPTVDGMLPAAREALTPLVATDMVAQYLAIAIDCEDARARQTVRHGEILQRYPFPLMQFRVALCGIPGRRLEPLRAADPRWVDTLFFEGRAELTRLPAPDVGRAAELYSAAHEAFPTSVAITLALGNVRNMLEEHADALALFDGVLAVQPTHRDALLGRVLSLSYLRRHYDAIRTATTMIDLGIYNTGDAYYWRAWNRYQVHELPSARVDAEAATKLMMNSAVFTLAGFIAYAQRELDRAVDRLDRAYRLDNTNCEAVWTEGMVRVDREEWAAAADRFVTAMSCFAVDAKNARDELAATESSTWAAAVKARRRAAAQKRADASDHRRAQSAFNAASSYLRLGNKIDALGHVTIAATHPLLRDKAAALRLTIEKLP